MRLHAAQIEAVRLDELIGRVRHRTGQMNAELAEVATQDAELQAQRGDVEGAFQALDEELARKQTAFEAARVDYETADRALRAGRDEQQRLSAERQRHAFELSAARERAGDVAHALEVSKVEAQRLVGEIEATRAELAKMDDSAARSGMDTWLAKRSRARCCARRAAAWKRSACSKRPADGAPDARTRGATQARGVSPSSS